MKAQSSPVDNGRILECYSDEALFLHRFDFDLRKKHFDNLRRIHYE